MTGPARANSKGGPISLLIFGAIFGAFGVFFQSTAIGPIFLYVGGAILVLGLVWLVVKLATQ